MCDDKKSWRMSITFKNDWWWVNTAKVQIFLEGGKIWKKMSHHIWHYFVTLSGLGVFFSKFCGVLRISELYVVWFMVNPLLNFAAGWWRRRQRRAAVKWVFFFKRKRRCISSQESWLGKPDVEKLGWADWETALIAAERRENMQQQHSILFSCFLWVCHEMINWLWCCLCCNHTWVCL